MTRKEKKNINDALNIILKNVVKGDDNYKAALIIGLNAGLIPIYSEYTNKVIYFVGSC